MGRVEKEEVRDGQNQLLTPMSGDRGWGSGLYFFKHSSVCRQAVSWCNLVRVGEKAKITKEHGRCLSYIQMNT